MRTLAIALTLLLLAPLAPAQQAPQEPQEPQTIVIEHLDFSGGTLAQFVETLRAMSDPEPVNILLRNQAGEITVPELHLRKVSLETALQVAVPDELPRSTLPDGTLVDWWIDLDRISDRLGASVYVIDANSEPADPPAEDEDRRFEVFGLGRVITDGDADGVLEIIDAAMSLDDADPAELRFHKDSGLLIVRGTHDQIVLIDEVVGRLEADRSRATGEDRQRAEHIADLEYQLQRAAARIELSRQQLEVAERNYQNVRDLVDAEFTGEPELVAAELHLIDRRTSLKQAEAEIFHIQRMLELARAEAADSSAVLAEILGSGAAQDQLNDRVRMLEQEITELRDENERLRAELDRSQP